LAQGFHRSNTSFNGLGQPIPQIGSALLLSAGDDDAAFHAVIVA
jgi:hypothetical protein